MNITRPMLAAAATSQDLEKLRYPLLASPKLDGIRCLIHPTLGPVTRSFKPIANHHTRTVLNQSNFVGLDGELMAVDYAGKPFDFNQVQSLVMSHAGSPDIEFWVFDWFTVNETYATRVQLISTTWELHTIIRPLPQTTVHNATEAQAAAALFIQSGFEGAVFRDPQGTYKSGRSTLKQQGMIKYKEFADAEGIIVDFEEKYHNQNPQERDAFGLAERSDKKEGFVPANTLGALIIATDWGTGRLGSGFDDALRQKIWDNKDKYLGRTVTFKYQKHGMQDLPRFPVFLRFREVE